MGSRAGRDGVDLWSEIIVEEPGHTDQLQQPKIEVIYRRRQPQKPLQMSTQSSWNGIKRIGGRVSIAVAVCVDNRPEQKQAKGKGGSIVPKVVQPPNFDKEREYFQEVDAFELMEETREVFDFEEAELQVCQGPCDNALIRAWEKWDEKNGSENDHLGDFLEKQCYVVFVLQHGGKDLESFVLMNFDEARSLLVQVTATLAVVEAEFEFEHRYLHWSGYCAVNNIIFCPAETYRKMRKVTEDFWEGRAAHSEMGKNPLNGWWTGGGTFITIGTQVGFSYNARGSIAASSLGRTLSFLELNKVSVPHIRVFIADHRVLSALSDSGVSVDLFLNQSLVENFTNARSSAILWLKTHVMTFLPRVNIKSITVGGGNDFSRLLSSLKLIHSVLSSSHFNSEVKKATLASSIPCNGVAVVMTVKSLIDPSAREVAQFAAKFSKSLENSQIAGQITELYAEVSSMEDFSEKELKREHEQIFPSSHRELLKTTSHDTINPPVTVPQDNPTPTIVTVPATNPVTTPSNPAYTPVPIPSTTPVMPVTNPVTTYPAPPVNVPVTTPVTNPVSPPATTNAPAIPGQSWCVAKPGASETALQSALDYACGMGGADCSQIQQEGSCYNPNTLQNHASYAFNSYYQKNPVATSCDFGGTAAIVNTNPSAGSCVFPLSSSSPSTPSTTTPSTTTPTPSTSTTNPTNPATTPSSSGPEHQGNIYSLLALFLNSLVLIP
ncbi:hypothetical protein GH714_006499 [Hevea brasiliensis]|uniref:X8 domain-containing protein n=1 Tax=Hevea brasiliensis TaxID=3981 RepID=A0A6A6NG35_HEVBR|nr:hypothetical protein GH714_006499 [Hevea brasiliensis]